MRSRAVIRAGLVKVLGLNVTLISSKSDGAARVAKSWQARRRFGRSSLSTCDRKESRHSSDSQNLRNVELVERIRLHTELWERDSAAMALSDTRSAIELLARPKSFQHGGLHGRAVAMGLGISPNSSLDDWLDWLDWLVWLAWLSLEGARLNAG